MGPADTGKTTVTSAELQKHLQSIHQARCKNAAVSTGLMQGRLVVRAAPKWNLLLRLYYRLQSARVSKQYRARMLDVLNDKTIDQSLKKQVFDEIASGQLSCFSQQEAARFRARKASFFRRASISGVDNVSRIMAGDSRRSPLPGGAFFVSSPEQKTALAEHYRRHNEKGDVAMIHKPSDLDKDDLIRTVSCSGNGILDTSAGRLFCDEPLTLVLDFTDMSPAQIASLNELFDTPPRYQGRTLGKEVVLVGLVSRSMLPSQSENPGPDFWRRMDSLGVCSLPESLPENLLEDKALITSMDDGEYITAPQTTDSSQVVDFYKSTGHWRTRLFGGFQLSDQGKLLFQEGALAKLDSSSGYIELINAPMDDPEFIETMAEAIRNQGFWANGQWTTLPGDLCIKTQTTATEQINHALSQFKPMNQKQSWACINDDNIETVLSGISLKQGRLLKNDTLKELMADTEGLVISANLPESRWVLLINQLQQLSPVPTLAIAAGTGLPSRLNLTPFVQTLPTSAEVALVPDSIENTPEVFEYHINARTQPETLLCSMPMASQQDMAFTEHYTPLMEALLAGQQVCLHGLETNPGIARLLESLLAAPPYLFIAGNRIDVPQLKLTCAVTPRQNLSGIWKQLPRPEADDKTQSLPKGFEQQLTERNLASLRILMDALNSIPRSKNRLYPDTPQKLDTTLLKKVAEQVSRETQADGCETPTPYHWRKALNDVLAKEYRGVPEVYGFVKCKINQHFPDTDAPARIDRNAISRWLSERAVVSPQMIMKHYWQLARYVSSSHLNNTDHYHPVSNQALATLMPLIIECAPAEQQATLAEQLNCQPGSQASVTLWDGDSYRRCYNALIAAGREGRQKPEQPVHQQALELSAQLSELGGDAGIPQITEILKQWITPELLGKDFRDLPEAITAGQDTHYRQLRRVRRLTEKLESTPLIMLKGEAGTGKTYTAFAVANAYANGKSPLVMSMSPEHTQADLFGKDVLKAKAVRISKKQLAFSPNPNALWRALCRAQKQPRNSSHVILTFDQKTRQRLREQLSEDDFYTLVEQFSDNYTEFESGPLLKWAEMSDPPVLILDEANLVKTGALEPLTGLKKTPPVLSIHGRVIPLTSKHRVLMTGNPESYDGRLIDPKLRKETLTLYYRPMSDSVLAEVILQPGMPGHWSEDCKDLAVSHCMTLYQQFRKILPNHTFGPRDLKDILARLRGYAGSEPAVMAQVDSMIWHAVHDCLGNEVSPSQQRQLRALRHWFHAHRSCDASHVEKKQQAFEQFYDQLKLANTGDKFDFNVPSVKELAFNVWLDMEKTGGKPAVIIEGEAGRGKDALLDRLLPCWQLAHGKPATFDRINASIENWEEIKTLATRAMREGRVLVISELNTLPSRYLEGFFNEVLNGEAAPGFKLIATINPASYSGREAFSEAMQSRCTLVKINPFTQDELQGLLERRYPDKQAFVQWLTSRHCQLDQQLKQAKSSVKLPTIKLMDAAEAMKDTAREQWDEAFAREYTLPKLALSHETGEPTVAITITDRDPALLSREDRLCRVVNSHLDQPVTITLKPAGDTEVSPTFIPPSGPLILPDNADINALISLAIKTIQPDTEPEAVERTERMQQQMKETLAVTVQEEKAREQAAEAAKRQATEPSVVAEDQSVPGSWALKLMPFKAIARLVSKLPLGKAVSLIGLLPFHHVLKLFKLLPLDRLVALAKYLPVERLATVIKNMPVEKMLEMVCRLPLERLFSLVDYLPLETIIKIVCALPLDKLIPLINMLPLERLAGLLKYLPVDRLAALAQHLPLERIAKAFEKVDLEKFAELGNAISAERLEKIMSQLTLTEYEARLKKLSTEKLEELLGTTTPGSEQWEALTNELRLRGSSFADTTSDKKETDSAKLDDQLGELKKTIESQAPEFVLDTEGPDSTVPDTDHLLPEGSDSDRPSLDVMEKVIRYLPGEEISKLFEQLPTESSPFDDKLAELVCTMSPDRFKEVMSAIPFEKIDVALKLIPGEDLKVNIKSVELTLLNKLARALPQDNPQLKILEEEIKNQEARSTSAAEQEKRASADSWLNQFGKSTQSFYKGSGSDSWNIPFFSNLFGGKNPALALVSMNNPREFTEELIRVPLKDFNHLKKKQREQLYRMIEALPESFQKQLANEAELLKLSLICGNANLETCLTITRALYHERRKGFIKYASRRLLLTLSTSMPESEFIEFIQNGSEFKLAWLFERPEVSPSLRLLLKQMHRDKCLEPASPRSEQEVKVIRIPKNKIKLTDKNKHEVASLFLQELENESQITELLLGLIDYNPCMVGEADVWRLDELAVSFKEIAKLLPAIPPAQAETEFKVLFNAIREGVRLWHATGEAHRPSSYQLTLWRLLSGVRNLHQQGLLSEQCYLDIAHDGMFVEPCLPVELGLEFLEDLKKNPTAARRARDHLDTYYQDKLGRLQEPGHQLPTHRKNQASAGQPWKITFLEQALGKRVINQEWSQVPGSRAPDIDRVARKESAIFPVNSAASELPAVIMTLTQDDLSRLITEEMKQNPPLTLSLSEREAIRQSTQKDLNRFVETSFRNELVKFENQARWYIAVPHTLSRRGKQLPPGIYDSRVLRPVLQGYYALANFNDSSEYEDYQSHIDAQQIPVVQENPNAILIDLDKGREMIREFIQQIPREVFYNYLFNKPESGG